MKDIIIKVEGMKCSGCENRITKALLNLEGIKEVSDNHEKVTVKVTLIDQINSKKNK